MMPKPWRLRVRRCRTYDGTPHGAPRLMEWTGLRDPRGRKIYELVALS